MVQHQAHRVICGRAAVQAKDRPACRYVAIYYCGGGEASGVMSGVMGLGLDCWQAVAVADAGWGYRD